MMSIFYYVIMCSLCLPLFDEILKSVCLLIKLYSCDYCTLCPLIKMDHYSFPNSISKMPPACMVLYFIYVLTSDYENF